MHSNLNSMKLIRVSFTATLKINVMIRGLSSAAAAAGKIESRTGLLKAAITEKGAEPNLVSFNSLIQELCGKYRLKEAEKVFEEMNRKGLFPDETTYTCLIRESCHQGQEDRAHKVLNHMILTGFTPSVAAYNSLLHAYCLYGKRLEEAVGIVRVMAAEPDVATYNTLIEGFCKGHQLHKALQMKAEMVHKGILPDADTYRLLIDYYMCSQRRQLGEAFDLFREMRVSPYQLTNMDLMNAYCLDGQFSMAFHLHDQVLHKGFSPDFVTGFSPSLVTYNAFIHGLCFFNRVEEALGILRGMPEMGLSPDAVSYNTVISGFCRIRETRKAYELKGEMDEKVPVCMLDEDTYESLMEDLSDEVTYSNLMNEYFAQGNLENAYNLDSAVEHAGYLPDSFRFSVCLNGLNEKATTRQAKSDLVRTFSSKCLEIPTYLIYDTLIENCSNNELKSVVGLAKGFYMRGLVTEAERAHDTMLEGNYKRDGAIYNLLIFDHCRRLNVHKAYRMYMEMIHYGFVSHMFSVLALIKVLHNDGRYKEMNWVIQNTLRRCNLNDSELLKVLNEIAVRRYEIDGSDFRRGEIDAFFDVVADIAMDGPLLDGGKCSYASTST